METWRRTVERERGELGFKDWTEAGSCGERERKALFPSKGKGNDHDDDFSFVLDLLLFFLFGPIEERLTSVHLEPIHITPKKFKNATITGRFIF